MKKLILIPSLICLAGSGNIEPVNGSPGCEKVRLYEKADFPVGVAVNFRKLKNEERYRELVIEQFNSITPEQSLKASLVHPEKERYDFTQADYLMDFCKRYSKRLHGHTLVWYRENPRWMERFRGSRSDWELMLKEHIQTIINHCKSTIKSWDVLNEAFNDDGSLRQNIWLKNIGESYIEKCFIYAAEADPDAVFFYNDFDLESREEKLNAVIKFFSVLKARGIRVDGIGMQMHVNINAPYVTDINLAAMKLEEKGFMVHYSEFDMSVVKTGQLWSTGKYLLKRQGERMKEIVAGYTMLQKKNRFGITMWGLTDDDSWLTERNANDRPLLFDARYGAKPAYCGFLEGMEVK